MASTEASTVIADGAATSGVVDLENKMLTGIHLGSDFDGASITFTAAVSNDRTAPENLTYVAVKDDAGATVTVTAAASTHIVLSPTIVMQLLGCRYLKLVANGNQTGDTTVVLVLEAV